MPLSINVGLSRKAAKDFQSTGVSINLVAELDATLLAKPQQLQHQIDALYQQAEAALNRQAGAPAPVEPERADRNTAARGGSRSAGGNGSSRGNGSGMTASQSRAIKAIAQRLSVDPDEESRNLLNTPLEDLTLRQASQLIDHLKRLDQPIGGRMGGQR